MQRNIWAVVIIAMVSSPALAAIKPCDELKAEIAAKLKEKAVTGYTLEIMPAEQVKDQKIVGSCEGGAKRISYSRN